MSAKRVFVLLAFLMIFISACGSDESSGEHDDTETIEGTLTVSAAASLTDAMNEIAKLFMQKYPEVQVDYNFGGSGALEQQIIQGAPADVFFSASESDFQPLVDKGYIEGEQALNLLANELVLIVPEGNHSITSFDEMDSAERIALGTPESVPAGAYSIEALESMGLTEALEGKFVYTEDVRSVLTYVETGNVDAGLVYRTDAEMSDDVEIADAAPGDSHEPIIYPVGIINDSTNLAVAKVFYKFLQSEEALEVFKDYGFIIE